MEEVDYCRDPEKVRLLPGVIEGLRRLKAAGFRNVIITNQSGIGRGWIKPAEYEAVHARLLELIGPGLIEAAYFCPDAPGAESARRKPSPAMVLEAAHNLGLDLARSWFIGDKGIDVQCGRNAGVRAILVQTGYGASESNAGAAYVARDFTSAVEFILRREVPATESKSLA
jgi:histidinol-phosphate phosphatase family protein